MPNKEIDASLRLECLKLAQGVEGRNSPGTVLERARAYADFVLSPDDDAHNADQMASSAVRTAFKHSA
jgi:hypothetical protein